MKKILSLLALTISASLNAGFYSNEDIDTYDPVYGKYYKAIEVKKETKGFLSKGDTFLTTNIAIYDPQTDTVKMLFEKDSQRDINVFIFESAFKHETIQFNGEITKYGGSYHSNIKNNAAIAERAPKNKLLIGTRDVKNKLMALWTAKKDGDDLTKITDVSFDSSWHIDIKNSMIRIITVKNGSFKIKNVAW